MANFYDDLLVALFLVVSGVYWYLQCSSNKSNSFFKCIPGPQPLPILGNILEFLFKSKEGALQNLDLISKQYGDICRFRIGPSRQLLLIIDYNMMEFVLSSSKLKTKSYNYQFFKNWLGDGLLVSDGVKWKTHRKILTPTFHFKILESFVKVFQSANDILIEKLKNEVDKDGFDVYPYITLYALDTICESAMGTSVDAQINEKNEYVQSVRTLCKVIITRTSSPLEMFDFTYKFTKMYRREKKALKMVHDYTEGVISSRRELLKTRPKITIEEDEDIYSKQKSAFLDLLLEARINGKPLPDKDIRDEVNTFMFEGHDTTSSAISFALFSLANNAQVQETAFNEQKCLFGDDLTIVPTYKSFHEMKYLDLVIKETLRLYPSVPFFARHVNEDFTYDGVTYPAGLTLILFIFGLQRSPKYFKNPLEFDPSRFVEKEKKPFANVPFSAGPRNCIGQKFAILEMKSVLSAIIRNFELLPTTPKHELNLRSDTVLKSRTGIKIRIKNRVY